MHIFNLFINLGIISLYSTFLPQLKDILNLAKMRIFLEVLIETTAKNPYRIDKIMLNKERNMTNLYQKISFHRLQSEMLELLEEKAKKVKLLLHNIALKV